MQFSQMEHRDIVTPSINQSSSTLINGGRDPSPANKRDLFVNQRILRIELKSLFSMTYSVK